MNKYTHGVSGHGYHIVVEGKLATREQILDYRSKLVEKITKELSRNDPYRDGGYEVRKLHDTYNRDLKHFVPLSDDKSVWMRDPDNIFDDEEQAKKYVDERNDKLLQGMKDLMQCDIGVRTTPGLDYALKYRYADSGEDQEDD